MLIDVFFFFKQKTAYELRISDWSSDVCSSDLHDQRQADEPAEDTVQPFPEENRLERRQRHAQVDLAIFGDLLVFLELDQPRSEEHTSELQSLMRISYAVFCLKKKKRNSIQS